MGRERLLPGYQLALALSLVAGSAAAQPPPRAAPTRENIEIELAVPAGCPGAEAVRIEARRLLGGAAEGGPPLRAFGSITPRRAASPPSPPGEAFVLDLTIERDGERIVRKLEARSCETAADVAALLISLAFAPDAVGKPDAPRVPPMAPRPGKPPPPTVGAAPPLPATLRVRDAEARRPRGLLGFAVRAGPLFGVADLPFPQVGGQVAADLRIESWTIEAGFEAGFAATHVVEDRPDAGANFLRLVGLLRGCRVLVPFVGAPWPRPTPGVDFSACVGLEVGQISGETFGVFLPERAAGLWLAPQLDLRLGIGITEPLSLVPHVGLAFPLTRPSFVITANEPEPVLVHQPGPVAGRTGITFEAQF